MIFTNIIGTLKNPREYSGYDAILGPKKGLSAFLSNLLSLLIILAGIFSLVNFIIAGYIYLSSNGNPQQIQAAGNKILQSLIGLVIIAAAFIIAGLIGYLFFHQTDFLFHPIFGGIAP